MRNSIARGSELDLSGNRYKILILADVKAAHYSSLLAARDFYRAGGIVLATDALPMASSYAGEQDEHVDSILTELFGMTASDAAAGKKGNKQTNPNGGIGWYLASEQIPESIGELILPDFIPAQGEGKVLHRKIGNNDLYMVMNVPKDTECFFRCKGKLELWDATDATMKTYPVVRQTEEGTYVKLKKDYTNSYLFIFSPGEAETEKTTHSETEQLVKMELANDWHVTLLPTLNNKWGDFRLPASDRFIGAEARSFRFAPQSEIADEMWMQKDFDDSQWSESFYGYAPQALVEWTDGENFSDTVSYSWKYGVWDNPGSQGWHGLKGKVSDGFFILDKGGDQLFRTSVYAGKTGVYRILQDGVSADAIKVDDNDVTGMSTIRLRKGWHELSVLYRNTEKQNYRSQTGAFRDPRKRGAVVFVPEKGTLPKKGSVYSDSIAIKWFYSDHLRYDLYGGKEKCWCYRFESVPGLTAMEFSAYGKDLKMWVDGKPVPASCITEDRDGELSHFRITLPEVKEKVSTVAFSLKTTVGYQATLALCEPVTLQTAEGLMPAGDWSEIGALRFYSGGMNYVQQVNIPDNLYGRKAMLDLGDVVATCEVKVNGTSAGILLAPPFQIDITRLLKQGNNKIEILVYSTLANHYQTIPTPYRGDPKAGLIGPVNLLFAQ